MIECAQLGFDAADRELNDVYRNLRSSLDSTGKVLLRDAQRVWIAFRDAECERISDGARGGTLAPVLYISCLDRLTQERTRALRNNPLTGGAE